MDYNISFIKELLEKGGPDKEDYYNLDAWITEIYYNFQQGEFSETYLDILRDAFGDAISHETMQGFAYLQPHGYAGDYEIIDRIYTNYISKKDHLKNWDLFFQSHLAPQAVRNRIEYLENCLKNLLTNQEEEIQVLNLASGPCRDIKNILDKYLESPILFDCVEQDKNAINFANNLCNEHLKKVNFIEKNAIKFKTNKLYNVIWSAGLFDYFNDKIFILMLKRLSKIVKNNGEIVIGNFSTNNPSRYYMELFKWNIYHRSPTKLLFLAKKAGFAEKNITIIKEATGVNLFLHIKVSH